jgi:hypothetical protein
VILAAVWLIGQMAQVAKMTQKVHEVQEVSIEEAH